MSDRRVHRLGWLPGPRPPSWYGYTAAIASVVLVSVAIGLVLHQVRIANISMLYLIPVLAMAAAFGRGPAVAAAVTAFLTYDWFFVLPIHELTIASPDEWLSLLLFLLVAIMTGSLAAELRRRADEATLREHEAIVLYDVLQLLSGPDLQEALRAVAARLRGELELAAVGIACTDARGQSVTARVGEPEELRIIAEAQPGSTRLLGAGRTPTAAARGAPGRWVRVIPNHLPRRPPTAESQRLLVAPIRVPGDRRVGTLFLVAPRDARPFTPATDRLLSVVAGQLGVMMEHARLRQDATEAEILRRTDELKTTLLNAVSHDLRTPLSSIIASAGSLRQEDVSWTTQERGELAEAIEEEAQRLNRIVGNLLDVSRVEGGHLHVEKAWYDLGALIDDVLGRLSHVTAAHHVMADVPADLPPVPVDYVEVDQVLSNLVENATRYTPPSTQIEIRARQENGSVVVEVLDQGPGIPPEALARLFEPFYRAAGPGPRPKGTGLGLAVARGIVEAHGGRIWAENRPEGGARFVFTLPLDMPAEHASTSGAAAA